MKILGIDPGIATTGFGVIETLGNKCVALEYGAILTPAGQPIAERLLMLHQALDELIAKHLPTAVAAEELFFNKNVKTALTVGHARGVILLTAAKRALSVSSYTPSQIKIAVSGYGRADKSQMQQMVKTLLNLPKIPKPDDVADALAVAICHSHSYRINAFSGKVLQNDLLTNR